MNKTMPNLTYDNAFKIVFKSEETRAYLKRILELILKQKVDLEKIELLDTEIITKGFTKEQGKVTDCYVKYKKYNVIFECNRIYYKSLYELKLRYLNAIYNNSYIKGNKRKENEEEFILVNINNFQNVTEKEIEEYYYKEEKILTKKIKIINISLERLLNKWYNETTLKELEKMFLFLRINHIETEVKKLIEGDELLMNIRETLRKMSNEECLEALFDKDEEDALELEEIKRYEKELGMAEGKAAGIIEGKAAEKKEMITAMYEKKMPLNFIAEVAKLQENKVRQILML